MAKKKPSAEAIRAATPLSTFGAMNGRAFVCWCGKPGERLGPDYNGLRLWREHDERDQPIPGDAGLVFIDRDHSECVKTMEKHPRLYSEVMGAPGRFPAVCGPCKHRDDWACRHPKLKANGGPGLLVQLRPTVPFNAIVCPPPSLKARAESCEGMEVAS